jgi:chromosome partitioning protein
MRRYPHFMLIAWANKKGGVGKSTLATHMAVWLHDSGFKTALLDADEQGSSSRWIGEAEAGITVVSTDDPDKCVPIAQGLISSHDFVIADAPGGMGQISRTLLLLADLAIFPIGPSILDVWSVSEATEILRYAQGINKGRPEGRLVLNKMVKRSTISRELQEAAPKLGLTVAKNVIRDLQVYRDAAQQGTVVSRLGSKGRQAAEEIDTLFTELIGSVDARFNNARRQLVENG